MLKKFYWEKLRRFQFIREIVLFVKKQIKYARGCYQTYAAPKWRLSPEKLKQATKLAVICDDLTFKNLNTVIDTVYLNVRDWRTQLEQERPELLFCESTWVGVDGCWSNEIYRSPEFIQDNRCVLKDILKYCRKAGIPTIFWNKEDTPEFANAGYGFISTALLFDHIFTTCTECIPKYQAQGHKSVHLMMFGYSPELFYPYTVRPRKNIAVFLGSWYEENHERCEDMCQIFDWVLAQGMQLRIYDRVSGQQLPDRQYPERYRPYILPSVPYEQTAEIMSAADYVININSVKDSQTMFARRVFEAMACGRIVISNDSIGLRKLFPNRIWFIGQPFDHAEEDRIIEQNMDAVHANYTLRAQLSAALNSAGIAINLKNQLIIKNHFH